MPGAVSVTQGRFKLPAEDKHNNATHCRVSRSCRTPRHDVRPKHATALPCYLACARLRSPMCLTCLRRPLRCTRLLLLALLPRPSVLISHAMLHGFCIGPPYRQPRRCGQGRVFNHLMRSYPFLNFSKKVGVVYGVSDETRSDEASNVVAA